MEIGHKLTLVMECCESIYSVLVLVPVPLKAPSVSDDFSDVTVKPGDLGRT